MILGDPDRSIVFPEERPSKEGLDAWLETATDDLTAPVRERIRVELQSHFADAVADHMANGFTEAEAKAAALSGLGSPTAARRRFHRRHLTEKDVERIGNTMKWASGRHLVWSLPLLVVACAVFLYTDKNLPRQLQPSALDIVVSVVLIFGLFQLLSYLKLKQGGRAPDLRDLVLLQMLPEAISIALFIWWFSRFDWIFCFAQCGPVIQTICKVWLWRKLLRVADIWQEMPPSKPVAPLSEAA